MAAEKVTSSGSSPSSQQTERLLNEAEQKIQAQEMTAAFEKLLQLEELEADAPAPGLAQKIRSLKVQAEREERRLSAQRTEVRELLEEAEARMDRHDYAGARGAIERASSLDVSAVDDQLADRIAGLETEVDSRLEELRREQQEALQLIDEGERKLAEGDPLGAFKVVMHLQHMDLADEDGQITSRMDALRRSAEQTEDHRADREEARELIEAARKNVGEWNLDAAYRHLTEATELEVCESDAELSEAADEVFSELEAARADASEKRARARELMEEVQAHIQDREFEAGFELMEELETLEVVQREDILTDEVVALRERAETEREKLESEREAVSQLLSEARRSLADWDVDTARARLEAAGRKSICGTDEDLADEVARVRSQLEASHLEIKEQRGEAIALLAEAEWNLSRCNFAEATASIEEVEELEAIQRDEGLGCRAEELREQVKLEENRMESERERVNKLLEDAQTAAQNWDFERVDELLQEAKETRPARFDSSVRRDIRAVRSSMEGLRSKVDRQRKKARRLLADAWRKVAGGQFEAAMKKLSEAENLELAQHDERLQNRLQRQRDEAEEKRNEVAADQQKAREVLQSVEEKKASGDNEGARKTLEEVSALDFNELKTEVRYRIEALREELGAESEQPAPPEEAGQEIDQVAHELLDSIESALESGDLQEATALAGQIDSVLPDQSSEDLLARAANLSDRVKETTSEARKSEASSAPSEDVEQEQIAVESLEELEAAMDRVIEGDTTETEEAGEAAAQQQPVRKAVRKKQPPTPGDAASAPSPGGVQTATASTEGQGGWFYFKNGERIGPMTLDDLAELAADGHLDPGDKVWLPTSSRWTQAKDVPEIAGVI